MDNQVAAVVRPGTSSTGRRKRISDVVQDPRERANLKDRRKDVFDRLKSDWEAWNSTMLPERSRRATYTNAGDAMADHYGVVNRVPATPQESVAPR